MLVFRQDPPLNRGNDARRKSHFISSTSTTIEEDVVNAHFFSIDSLMNTEPLVGNLGDDLLGGERFLSAKFRSISKASYQFFVPVIHR